MKNIAFFSAGLASSMNIIFLSSWHLEFPSLLQPPPSTWPIPYPAALCLLLSGVGIFSFFRIFRFPLTQLLGLSIFLVGSIQFAKIFGLPLGFPIDLSQLTLAASIGFMLVGIELLFWKRKQNLLFNSILLLSVSSLIIFLGAAGMFVNMISIHENHLIHFYTAFGFFLVGLGFLFSQFHMKLGKNVPAQKWPLFIKRDRK